MSNVKIQINFKSSEAKQILYSNAFKNLIFDQINYIQNQNHQRVISEKNGLSALELAIKAKQLSEKV